MIRERSKGEKRLNYVERNEERKIILIDIQRMRQKQNSDRERIERRQRSHRSTTHRGAQNSTNVSNLYSGPKKN